MSTNQDSTPSRTHKHFNNVNKLQKIRLTDFGYDFFANGTVKMISIGKKVPKDVASNLFSASMTGSKCFTKF